jgi:hypothetical protein
MYSNHLAIPDAEKKMAMIGGLFTSATRFSVDSQTRGESVPRALKGKLSQPLHLLPPTS